MTNMKFSNRSKYSLLCLLALLNIIIRIPSIPHERGSPDEFTIHSLANSLTTFGHANWWAHPSSIFGFYPYSYASSSPFAYSGISQCTGINLEWIAWIFCTFLGIFVMFSAYSMAGQIKNDDIFKLLVAFIVSLSQSVLTYLTWQTSARGFFLALLPFFIYLLLKSRISVIRFGALTFIIFILIMATHHYYVLTVPIIVSFIILIIFCKLMGHVTKFIKFPEVLTSSVILAGILGMFSIPFFTGLFIHGNRYSALSFMLEQTIRYNGPIFLFAIAGLSYLILKRDREFGECFSLSVVIFWIPFMWIRIYSHYFASVIISILISVALLNVTKAYEREGKKVLSIVILVLLLSTSFSGFYQHWRTNIGRSAPSTQWYVEDTTYNGALWVKDNIDDGKKMIGSATADLISTRVFAISKVPTLVMRETDITYGFVNGSDIRISSTNSPLSVEFYIDSPYIGEIPGMKTTSDKECFRNLDVDSKGVQQMLQKYNLSYYIEDSHFRDIIVMSLQERRGRLYDNGRIRIWCLNEL